MTLTAQKELPGGQAVEGAPLKTLRTIHRVSVGNPEAHTEQAMSPFRKGYWRLLMKVLLYDGLEFSRSFDPVKLLIEGIDELLGGIFVE